MFTNEMINDSNFFSKEQFTAQADIERQKMIGLINNIYQLVTPLGILKKISKNNTINIVKIIYNLATLILPNVINNIYLYKILIFIFRMLITIPTKIIIYILFHKLFKLIKWLAITIIIYNVLRKKSK